jgi:hypothetical protein
MAIHQLLGLLDCVSIALAGDDNGCAHDVVVLDLVDPIVGHGRYLSLTAVVRAGTPSSTKAGTPMSL